MILNQTFSKQGFEKYLDYVMMISDGDFRKVRVDVCDEIILDNFDYAITNHMRNHKIYGLENSVYKICDENDLSRYVYAHVSNDTIINILFDDEQVRDIETILNEEKMKEQIIYDEAYNQTENKLELDNLDYEDIVNLEDVYDMVEWKEIMTEDYCLGHSEYESQGNGIG